MGSTSDVWTSEQTWPSPLARVYSGLLDPAVNTGDDGKWGPADQAMVARRLAENGAHGAITDIALLHSHPGGTVEWTDEADVTHQVAVSPRQNPYEEYANLFDDLIGSDPGSATNALLSELSDTTVSPLAGVGDLTSITNAMTTGMASGTGMVPTSLILAAFDAAVADVDGLAAFTAAASGAIAVPTSWATDVESDLPSIDSSIGNAISTSGWDTAVGTTMTAISSDVSAVVAAEEAREAAFVAREQQRMADSFQSIRGVQGSGYDSAIAFMSAEAGKRLSAHALELESSLLSTKAGYAHNKAALELQAKSAALDAGRLKLDGVRTIVDYSERRGALKLQAKTAMLEASRAKAELLFREMAAKVDAILKTSGDYVQAYLDATKAEKQLSVQLGIALAGEYRAAFIQGWSALSIKGDTIAKLISLRNLRVENKVRQKLWNVELLPYWASALSLPGAANVKRNSAFENVANVAGTVGNTAATIINAIQALR